MARKKTTKPRIESFNLTPGRIVANKYRIEAKLGSGWEGEVYRAVEIRTGIHRAAKFFFPHRNVRDRAVRFYARKMELLKRCAIVIQYLHTEQLTYRGVPITCLISEYVEGDILDRFIARQPGRRLPPFEGMHLLYSLALGLEQIHQQKEYHGDIHSSNVMVRRRGIYFDVKLVDFYHWGAANKQQIKDDVADLVRVFYDALGGQKRYAQLPPEVRAICRGLRKDLIASHFPTASHLRHHLETFPWQ